jgi:uncharacterized protein (TIGR03382 family)
MQRNPRPSIVTAAVAIAAIALTAASAHAITYTMTATADGPNPEGLSGQAQHNDWNNPANWSGGVVPSGAVDAVVGANLFAEAWSNSTPAYSGSLTLSTNSTLQLGWTTSQPNSINALGGAGITLNSGSQLRLRMPAPNPIMLPDIMIAGDASIDLSPSTSAHHTTRLVNGVDGIGALTVIGNNNNTLNLDMANPSWSGGFIADAVDGWRVQAEAAGAFGTGDVEINFRPAGDRGVSLQIDAADVIDDMAMLSVNGPRDQRKASKLILNAGDEVVGAFILDGVDLGIGTWDASSGLLDSIGNPLITGNGSITVLANAIPEPATATLGLLALGGLGAMTRRRRRMAA